MPILSQLILPIKKGVFIVGFCMLTGIHLLLFQSIAWLNMYQNYREYLPAEIALDLTLSGEEVCGLCEAVEQARDSMNKGYAHFLKGPSLVFLYIYKIQEFFQLSRFLIYEIGDVDLIFPSYSISIDPPPPKLFL